MGRSGIALNVARLVSLILLLAAAWTTPQPAVAAGRPTLGTGGPLPLTFEPNQGQADGAVRFLARGRGYGLFLSPTESVLVLTPPAKSAEAPLARRPQPVPGAEIAPAVVRMRLIDARPEATISGVDPLPGRSHYLIGDRSHWRRDVPTFARVRYADVYPGVSLVFYGSERELEYDFVVAPGADPGAVALAFEGAEALRIDDGGDLILTTAAGELRLRRPLIYQESAGARRPLEGGYVLDNGRVRFRVAAWDRERPLVIDPVLGYSTYLGGVSNDQGFGIALDSDGNAYVTGATVSSNFPVSATPVQALRGGVTDVFVTKLDPSGSTVMYSTFLGGSGDEAGNAIAVDTAGNAYVTGTTSSTNFPLFGAFQPTTRGGNEAFVAKLDPSGSTLVYSTYIGSTTDDVANGIAIDALGNAYITGSTQSATFPNNNAVICLGAKSTGLDAFVLRLDATGATVDYCRFIGGTGTDIGQGIAADAAGNVWVVGSTNSVSIGAVNARQPTLGGNLDGFVARLDPLGALAYLTYLGGALDDEAFAVAVDPLGNAYVAGSTISTNFPLAASLQSTLAGRHDAFVSKLSADGGTLLFSTYLGGTGEDVANGIAVNPTDGTVYVVGSTGSVDFPLVQAFQGLTGGRLDAFVSKLGSTGAPLIYSTFLGGAGDDVAQAVAVDADGVAHLTGSTNSTNFPTQTPLLTATGLLDAFVTQIADGGIIQFTATGFQIDETASTAVISVQRTGDTSATSTVEFVTSDGTATAGADYTAVSTTLTFVPGQIVATVSVPILDDLIGDGDETVVLTLRNPSGGAVLGARKVVNLTILDDEPSVNFSAPTFTVAESRGPGIVTVNRSGPTAGTVLVDFQTSDGTAVAGVDYTAVSRTLTFGPGVRAQTVSIPITQDTLSEGTETVNLRLLNVRGGTPPALLGVRSTAVLQVTDEDDKGGNVQFIASTFFVKEPASGQTANAVITVTRAGGSASGVSVDYQTTDGPAPNGALAGTNYTPTAGRLTFAAGQTSTTFTVPILSDTSAPRGNPLTVALSLTNPQGGAILGTPSTALLAIDEFQANVAFTQSQFAVAQSAPTAPIVVRRAGSSTGPVTVNYSTTTEGTTAIPDVDFRPVAGTLTFPSSNTNLTFSVPILNNPNGAGRRTVGLAITAGTGNATIVEPRTATLTINQTALAGAVEFASATFEVSESVAGGLATIGVIRSGGTLGGVTVGYVTSDNGACPAPAGAFHACAGSDYTATTGTVTFGPGETFKTFTVPILNDAAVEGIEAFTVSLTNPQPADSGVRLGVRSSAQVKIVDDELALGFSATNYQIAEGGGSVTVKVELTGVSAGPVTVQYATSDGTATAGQDYIATSGTLTFPAPGNPIGIRTQTFTVPILQDTLAEGTETINLTLSVPAGGAQLITGRSTAIVSILDDEQGGILEFDTPTFSVSEGSGLATITVRRTASPGAGPLASGVTVDYATSDGSATAGLDYTAAAGRLTFGAGETLKTFTIPILDDTLGEGDETVNLRLVSPRGGGTLGAQSVAALTIVDDDPYVGLSAATYAVTESSGVLTVTVNRGGVTTGQVTVDYTTADQRPGGTGKAVGGVDYTPVSGTLTFAPGVRLLTFQVPIITNTTPDPDRKFDILLRNATPAGVTLLPPGRAEVTITDDDAGGVIQFAAPLYTVSETGGEAVVTVIRSAGTGAGVSVLIETGAFATTPIAPTATANVDYTALMTGGTSGRRVLFGAGETTKTVRIPIIADALAEGVEQFDVKLSAPCAGSIDPTTLGCLGGGGTGVPTLGPLAIASILIVDAQQTVQFSAPEFVTVENSPAATLEVVRTGPATRLLVDYMTSNLGACPAAAGLGTACAGTDYQTTSGTLVFEPGVNAQRITVPLIDNRAVDVPRLFRVDLANLRSSDGPPVVIANTLGPRMTANVRIKEDDRGGTFSVTGGFAQETNGTTSATVTISRTDGTGGPVSVFFHARQCGIVLPTTLVTTPPQLAGPCEFVAQEGVDFDPISERITFLPGELSKTRTIIIHGNAIPEGSRDIRIQLTEPLTGTGPGVASIMQDNAEIGAKLGGAQALLTIVEDDLYFVRLSSENYSVSESAGEALITVLRTGLPSFLALSQDLDIIAVTAGSGPSTPVAGQDFVDLGVSPDNPAVQVVARENPFRFMPNETSKIFRVPLLDDSLVDGPKEFQVYIRSAANNGTPTGPGLTKPSFARLTVTDDDAGGLIQFASATYMTAEDTPSGLAIITLSRTGGAADMVTVLASTVNPVGPIPADVAVPNVDYMPVTNTPVTFAAGSPIASFVVPLIDDGVADGVKTVQLQIANPQPAGFAGSPMLGAQTTAELRIVDAGQSVAFAHADTPVDEGAGTGAVVVERTGDVSGVLTVDFATSDGTAVNGVDYTGVSGTLTFAAGQTQAVLMVPVIDNTTVGLDKTVSLTLTNPSAGVLPPGRDTATLTIKDDDKAGVIGFAGPSFIVQETTGQADVTIVRTGGTAGCPLPLTVPTPPTGSCAEATYVTFSTADSTALAGSDYTTVTTVVEFGASETIKTVAIPIISDGPGEGTEVVGLQLSTPMPNDPLLAGRAPALGVAAATLSILETEFRIGATAYTFGEGGGPAVVTVVRVGDLSGTASVDFVTVDGTAVSSPSGDFTGVTSGQLSFAAGEAVKTLSITLTDDSIAETDESFDIVFSNPVSASIARDTCATAAPAAPALVTSCSITVNVLDNEIGGVITFSQPVFDATEPATPTAAATITVRRTAGGAANVTVDFATGDDSALDGVDYDAATGTITFGLGETLKTFTVPVRNGVVGVRSANLFLLNATGGAAIGTPETAALRITDRDNSVGFTALGYSVTENVVNAAITVRRTGTTGTVQVGFTTADQGACPAAPGATTACAGSDYTATATTLTFPAGTNELTVMVPINNDGLVEPNETFAVTLSNPTVGGVPVPIAATSCAASTATTCTSVVTILDDDQGGLIQFSTDAYQVVENVAGGQAAITLSRTGGLAGAVQVTLDVDPALGVTPLSQTVTFASGQPTATAFLIVTDNALAEGNRSGTLTISNPAPALQAGSPKLGTRTTATLLVIDDEPYVFFPSDTFVGGEGGVPAVITVARKGSLLSTVMVDYAATDGTATPPRYTQVSGTLTFGPNVTSQTFTVPLGNDTTLNGTQSVVLTLSLPRTTTAQAAAILGTNPATLLINDDDRGGTISFGSAAYTIPESSAAPLTITINRSSGNSGGITATYAVTGGTAVNGVDFTVTGTGSVLFGPNETVKTFTLTPMANSLAQGPKTVILTLTSATPPAVLDAPSQTTVTILDQEQTLVFSAPAYSARENGGPAPIVVNRVGPTTGTVLVNFTTLDGTATAAPVPPATVGDYTAVTRTLTFGPGVKTQTVTVPIVNDGLIEGNETFTVQLSDPRFSTGVGSVGFSPTTCVTFVTGPPDSCTATVTIVDDDLGGAIQFSAATYTVAEGTATAPIMLTRTGGLGGPVTVHLTAVEPESTTSAGLDYVPVDTIVTFPAGVASVTVPISLVNDTIAEGTETLKLKLSTPTGGAVLGARDTAVLSLTDNDLGGTIEFSQTLFTVGEAAGLATITITRAGGAASGATVDFLTMDPVGLNGAVAGVHYTPTATAVIFGVNETRKTLTVQVANNATQDGNKTVLLALANPRGGAKLGLKSAATLKILDDEATVQLGASAFSVNEGTSAVITVERTGTLGTVVVPYSTAALPGVCPAPNGSGRACPGVDFTSRSGSLTFNPGVMSLTISVPTLANSRQEGNRAFVVNLGAPSGTAGAVLGPITTGTVTIVDDDRAGALAFFGNPYRSSELGVITLSVRRASTTVAGPVTVNFATADGSGKAGVDYVPAAGTLTFGVGSTVASITVNVLPNTRDDGDRTFLVALSGPTGGATLGNPSVATVTIGDDDVGGTIQFSAPTFTATECAALPCFASLTLSRAGGGASAVSVDFVTVDGSGNALSDYIATSGTVTFGANQAAATIRIPLQIEPGAQTPRTFGVILSSPRGGAVLGARTTATVTVTDTR